MKSTREVQKKPAKGESAAKKGRTAAVQIPADYDLLANLKADFPQKRDLISTLHKAMPINRGGTLNDYSKAQVNGQHLEPKFTLLRL